jgi:ABC-type Fe3+/spermidine/putrescine transport system ATPase subunit
MSEILMQLSHVSKKYDSNFVINDLSFDIYDGEFISILGPSGAGKTTLLQLIAGQLRPDVGEITIQGTVVSPTTTMLAPEKYGIHMVFHKYTLSPHMNVYEHIEFGLKRQNLPRAEHDQQFESLLQLFELQGLEKRLPAELSGGQQQRVAIATALATNPKLLLLDDPMSNLDGYLRLQIRNQLKAMFKKLGTTVLYVTHDPVEALSMADRLLIINEGTLEQIDTPQSCYITPTTPRVAGLLGASNRTMASKSLNNDRVFNIGTQTVRALNPFPNVQIPIGQRVEIRSRPEDIIVLEQEPGSLPPNYGLNRPIVVDSSFEGKYWRITLLNHPDILFNALHDTYLKPGSQVWITMDSNKLFVYPITDDH